jgi:RNA polymerase sigma factor (sigma-70 family)
MSRTVRDVHNPQARLSRYRAERLLRSGFSAQRSKVLAIVRAKLRAQGLALAPDDLEACYSQAWHGLYAAVAGGEAIENPEGWLVLVSFRRAIDEARSARRAQLGAEQDAASDGAAASSTREPEIADALDDRARLRAVFEALRAALSEREREAASLCYLQGLSRAQAAARMGIGERRMQKLMEGPGGGVPGLAAKVGGLLATIRAGGWCEQQGSLMRAYAFGVLDPAGERHALAVAHTRACPACRAHVAALRGLASILPPLPFAPPLADGGAARSPGAPRAARAPGAPRGSRIAGLRRVGAAVARRMPVARGLSLPKLAALAASLLAVGTTYLLTRSWPSPARAGLVQSAPAPRAAAPGEAAARASSPVSGSGGQGARRPPGSTAHRPSRARRARPAGGRAPLAGSLSPREFSPERVRGEAPPPSASTPPAPAGGREGEFGIE